MVPCVTPVGSDDWADNRIVPASELVVASPTVRPPRNSTLPLAPVVVAIPLTSKLRVSDCPVDEAYTIVVKPVTPRVPEAVTFPVLILVLIVVAAPTETAIKRVDNTSDIANERTMPLFPMLENRCIH